MNNIALRKTKDLSLFSNNKDKYKNLSWVGTRYGKANRYLIINKKEPIGFITSTKTEHGPVEKGVKFVGIYVRPEDRGKGIARQAEKLLVKREKIKTLLATINKSNSASLKAHKKMGFKYDPKTIFLRKNKRLKKNQIRFYKKFNKTAELLKVLLTK